VNAKETSTYAEKTNTSTPALDDAEDAFAAEHVIARRLHRVV
jgi:hypothetical protein